MAAADNLFQHAQGDERSPTIPERDGKRDHGEMVVPSGLPSHTTHAASLTGEAAEDTARTREGMVC